MVTRARQQLRLIAPWYRWQRQRDESGAYTGPLPRETRPVFQKYDRADMANVFLKDPQRSFRFTNEDFVHFLEPSPYDSALATIRNLHDVREVRTTLRKLFRETHKRSYLVVCELHCDLPGLPDASWDHICEAGFVVRRYRITDSTYTTRRDELDARIALLRAHLIRIVEAEKKFRDLLLEGAEEEDLPEAIDELRDEGGLPWLMRIVQYQTELALAEAERQRLERLDGVATELQGWIPDSDYDTLGSWQAIDEHTPQTITEKVYPLYKLIPDPTVDDHSAEGAQLLFGNVPTGSIETESDGAPHLDREHVYEIRCFVRHHNLACKRLPRRGDCKGALIWSQATETYRLAGQFDSDGTRNTIINIEMPDLAELAAQATKPPSFSIRMHTPPKSQLSFSMGLGIPTGGSLAGPMMCSVSIPLITIIATFVLNIFKPIVVYLFQLWHLLPLKFCFAGLPLPSLTNPVAALDDLYGAELSVGTTLEAEFREEELRNMVRAIRATMQAEGKADRTSALIPEDRVPVRPRVDDAALIGAA